MVETPYPHIGDMEHGKPLILNERHWFYKLSGTTPVSKYYPHLSNRLPGGYCRGSHWRARQRCEHRRLEDKMIIFNGSLKEAALKSISMGLFQIMGFNHKVVGYPTVFDMWESYKILDDSIDLRDFFKFCEVNSLLRYLRNERFDLFARGYNGPNYRINRYDELLAEYTQKFRKERGDTRSSLLRSIPLAKVIPLPPDNTRTPHTRLTGFPDFSQLSV